jgi:hypothetical protein
MPCINVARNDTASMWAGTSFRKAIDASSIAACGRLNHIDLFFVVVVDFVLRNETPTAFTDLSKVMLPTENGRLGVTKALQRSRADSTRTIDLEECVPAFHRVYRHVKGMVRSKTTAAQERKVFFGLSNFFISIVVRET